MKNERLFILCLTLVLIAVIASCWSACDRQRNRRQECVMSGRSISECKDAFAP